MNNNLFEKLNKNKNRMKFNTLIKEIHNDIVLLMEHSQDLDEEGKSEIKTYMKSLIEFLEAIKSLENSEQFKIAKKIDGFMGKNYKSYEFYDTVSKIYSNFNNEEWKSKSEFSNMTKRGSVLIIDDDVEEVSEIEEMMTESGFEVYVAVNPRDIMRHLNGKEINYVLVSDEIVNRYSLVSDIRRGIDDKDVSLITIVKNDTEKEKSFLKEISKTFIKKPISAEEIIKCIEGMTGEKIEEIDKLTNVYTKAMLKSKESMITEGVVAIIDIDDFSTVNRIFGEAVGDEIIKQFIDFIKLELKSYKEMYRISKNEFLIVFEEKYTDIVLSRLEEIRNKIEFNAFVESEHEIFLTFSTGVSKIENKDIKNAIQRAQSALYMSKKRGKNKVTYYKQGSSLKNLKKILLVGENKVIMEIKKKKLEELGCEVLIDEGSKSVISSEILFEPDLILIDLTSIQAEGVSMCMNLKMDERFKNSKVVLIGTLEKKSEIARCLEVGVDDYILKPYTIDEIAKKLMKIIEI